jgi:hypothetical protein
MTFFFEAKINAILSKEYRFFFYYFYQAYFYNVSTTFCLRVSVLFFGINLSAKYTFVIKPGFISLRFSIHIFTFILISAKVVLWLSIKRSQSSLTNHDFFLLNEFASCCKVHIIFLFLNWPFLLSHLLPLVSIVWSKPCNWSWPASFSLNVRVATSGEWTSE